MIAQGFKSITTEQLMRLRSIEGNGYGTGILPALIDDLKYAIETSLPADYTSAIASAVATAISDLVGGAPAILDTLNEIAASINDDGSVYNTLTTAISGKEDAGVAAALVASRVPLANRRAVAISTTALVTDTIIAVTNTDAARTVTLPAANTFGDGQILIVKDESGLASVNNITITPNGVETIDGAANDTISTNYGVSRLYSNGVNAWFKC